MKIQNIFMSGNWEDLIMTTFEIDKHVIQSYLPKDTELDLYKGKALMSMVAFTFSKVNFFGFKIPMHQHFGQINFRFYVKSKIDGTKGVVFIKEFAPKPIIALIANLFYNEPYFFKSITINKLVRNNTIKLEYKYKRAKTAVIGIIKTHKLIPNTLEQFVVDRNIAFVKNNFNKTFQYKIFHKPWELYEIQHSNFDSKILKLLPLKFKNIKHISTCFVNGSSIHVQKGIPQ
ncbi:DUF2071 domain-containing protein [Flavivirga algicola]|uniref:DUF2071 domain-containing protein n=1 Tax=Flavivirga algicola TaxID=2729136 RepID=A0ABX1RZX1_9FLAO|nr:DUF2071 domain-containing protein [Flavivirga algicola]NMH87739.1 DUF2071 domain-containing protein [Flavivirga algicola]